jgi:transposase-like protein
MTQITLLTGPERRRRWSDDERRRILAAAFMPGAIVADVARQFEVSTSLIYKWRQQTVAGEPLAAASRRIGSKKPPLKQENGTFSAVSVILSGAWTLIRPACRATLKRCGRH